MLINPCLGIEGRQKMTWRQLILFPLSWVFMSSYACVYSIKTNYEIES